MASLPMIATQVLLMLTEVERRSTLDQGGAPATIFPVNIPEDEMSNEPTGPQPPPRVPRTRRTLA